MALSGTVLELRFAETRLSSEQVWTTALNLSGFEVVTATAERTMRLTVVPNVSVGVCPHCGGVCNEVHQTRDLDGVRDLPLADRAVELRVRVAQFWCSLCGRGFTPPVPELVEEVHATEPFLSRAAELIRHGDVLRAAQFLRVPEKAMERWQDKIANDFCLPLQQRPHRGLQQRPPHHPPPNFRNAQLPPLPTASPRPIRKTSNTRINLTGGEPIYDAVKHCTTMLRPLLSALLSVLIDHGADEAWGPLYY